MKMKVNSTHKLALVQRDAMVYCPALSSLFSALDGGRVPYVEKFAAFDASNPAES